MSKEIKWVRARHVWVKRLSSPVLRQIVKRRYHCELDHFPSDGRNYLILSNHQTDFDQYIVSLLFKQPLYFVAMEDVFSRGFFSRFIEWVAAPIPILKASSDQKAVRDCVHVARQGGSIALFPEGNRTYCGKSCYIKPQVASLVKLLKLPIVIVRLEGGFGVKPRWADKNRSGKMHARICSIIEPEEYKSMDRDDLYERICHELYVDDTAGPSKYESPYAAEGMERMLHYCPEDGLTTYLTKGTTVTCQKCGRSYQYRPDLCLESESDHTAKSITQWYDAQESFMRQLDITKYTDTPAFCDTADITQVILYKNKQKWKTDVKVSLYSDRIQIEDGKEQILWKFDDIKSCACIDGHKLNIYLQDKLWQMTGDVHFNALKYCNFYFHYQYCRNENHDEFQFLGL